MAESPVGFPSRDTSSRGQTIARSSSGFRAGCWSASVAPGGVEHLLEGVLHGQRPPDLLHRRLGIGGNEVARFHRVRHEPVFDGGGLDARVPLDVLPGLVEFPANRPNRPDRPDPRHPAIEDTVDGQGHRRPRSRACHLRIGRRRRWARRVGVPRQRHLVRPAVMSRWEADGPGDSYCDVDDRPADAGRWL
jgi:hypothetical protein